MKAAASAQLTLLDLQAVDTVVAQLEHRRRSLPEHALIAAGQKERSRQGDALVAARTVVGDLELEQEKAERDLTPVRDRLARDQVRVADGSVTDPKQLSALIEEIQHLKKRISDLEDIELEVMQRVEDATAEQSRIAAERAAGDAQLREWMAARAAKLSELDAELADHNAERARLAAEVPDDLVAVYDRIRVKAGGTGAAALRRGRCGGCQLEATAFDLTRYAAAPADEVLRCEECNRILVRVKDSGL